MRISPRSSKARHLLLSFFLVVGTLGLSAITAAPAFADVSITSQTGPLTSIRTTDQLNCAVHHLGDSSGEFFADTACGTLVHYAGALHGPAGIPAGPATVAYQQVSQTPVTGSGSSGNPFQIVTVADTEGPGAGLQLTQTDTYVEGEESYRTDVHVENIAPATITGVLYRAGDCYLQNSDVGFGDRVNHGSVSCVENQNGSPGDRIEQWSPITNGSHNMEDGYGQVWNAVASGNDLPDTCQCNSSIDNGAGLSWAFSLAPGAFKTFSDIMTFSPLGTQPLLTTKTADQDTVQPGDHDGYTITISNPNVQDATLDTITDDLPSGFVYDEASSTLDANVIVDPSGVGSGSLVWDGPFVVPGDGSVALHFSVQTSLDQAPGDYFNHASGTAQGVTVVPTGATAKVTVAGTPEADLSVSQTDTPDPVNSGNDVLYHVSVTNNGPDSSDTVTLIDHATSGSFVSVTPEGNQGTCFENEDSNAECNLGPMASGQTIAVDAVFQAPDTAEGTQMTSVADVSSVTNDPNAANNHSEETTEVDPEGQGTGGNQGSSGYIPPTGGSLTTDPGTGATLDDPTVITMKLGSGPGGEGSVEELPDCTTDPDLSPCVGDIGNFSPPDGYNKIHVTLVYDKNAVAGGLGGKPRKQWKVYFEKDGATQPLAKCPAPKVPAASVPCWTSIFRTPDRDLHVKVLINSDPKLATRK